MNYKIYERHVRFVKEVKHFPPFKDIRFVGCFLHFDSDGNFVSLQYALYFPHATYTVDLPNMDDWAPFRQFLLDEFKKAGVKPPLARGHLQAWSGEDTVDTEECKVDSVE